MATVLQSLNKQKFNIMKKMMVIILFCAGTTAFAQTYEFGVKGGLNLSNFTGTTWNNAKVKSLIGYHAGAFISLFLGENFAIQPEVMFSSQGAKYEDATTSQNLKLNYITIPVMLKYRSTGGFFVEAGPQIGFRSGDLKTIGTVTSHAKATDLAIAGGLGYQSKIGLGVGARYVAGLSKVGDF